MATAEGKGRGRGDGARPGSVVGYTGGDRTLIGTEEADDMPEEPVVTSVVLQRHEIRSRTLFGLLMLLVQVLLLGALAMAGVGLHWFDPTFAIAVLGITVTPSFTAWLLVVRWAFRSRGSADR